MKQVNLSIKKIKGKDKDYELMFITLPSGLELPIKLVKYNYKLMYRIKKELE